MNFQKQVTTTIYPRTGTHADVVSELLTKVAAVQSIGGVCALIDGPGDTGVERMRKLGVKVGELLISQPDTPGQAFQIAETLIRSGSTDLVVLKLRPKWDEGVSDALSACGRALAKSNTAFVIVGPEVIEKAQSAPLSLSMKTANTHGQVVFTIDDVRDTGLGTYLGTTRIGGIEFHCELTAVCDPTEDEFEFGEQETVDPGAYPGFENLLVAFEPDGGFETIAVRNHPVMEDGDYVLVIYPYSRS